MCMFCVFFVDKGLDSVGSHGPVFEIPGTNQRHLRGMYCSMKVSCSPPPHINVTNRHFKGVCLLILLLSLALSSFRE